MQENRCKSKKEKTCYHTFLFVGNILLKIALPDQEYLSVNDDYLWKSLEAEQSTHCNGKHCNHSPLKKRIHFTVKVVRN